MLRTFFGVVALLLLGACANTPPANTEAVVTQPATNTSPAAQLPTLSKPAPRAASANPVSPTPAKPPEAKLDRERAVFFATASFDVSDEGMKTVRKYAARLNGDRRLVVMLVGSSDDLGSKEMCVALANKRAAAVEEELLNLGVRPQQIRKYARGCEAVSDGSCVADTCRQQYRRVDLRIDNS